MDPLRILLVDDHLLFRKGLARLLDTQPDFEVVGEATDGLEGIEKARVLEPDVVLTDIEMPRLGGLEVTRRIKAQLSGVRVVVLTFSEDEQDLLAAVRCGADGYLLKDLTPEALFQQLRLVAAGDTPLARGMVAKLFRYVAQTSRPAAQPAAVPVLSRRERDVLTLMVGGYSNPEIADELGIARNTVKNHVGSILTKLGVKNRAQAVAHAVSRNLVSIAAEPNVSGERSSAP